MRPASHTMNSRHPARATCFTHPSTTRIRAPYGYIHASVRMNSCCELMERCSKGLRACRQDPTSYTRGPDDSSGSETAAQDAGWFQTRRDPGLLHPRGAPYFAMDLSKADAGQYDLLIMRRNLRSFEDERQFLRYSAPRQIMAGFQDSRLRIHQPSAVLRHLARLKRSTPRPRPPGVNARLGISLSNFHCPEGVMATIPALGPFACATP